MDCYLDNSATTRASENVIKTVTKVMAEDFGNPSSKHRKGVESEAYLNDAKKTLAKLLKVEEKEILFTSGGTESNNLALIGCALANQRQGRHIITTCFEHPSVLEPLKLLSEQKEDPFEITYLQVDADGHIDRKELEDAIRPDTILVSIMMVNNEIGAVQDIAQIGELIKQKNPKTLFHVDAIQAFGKFEIYPKKWKIDLLSVSSHKFHGPKGVGFLYVKEGIKIRPLILGGGQQKGMRSGTDNVPGIAGMAVAAAEAYANREENVRHMTTLKNMLTDGLMELAEDGKGYTIRINSKRDDLSAPHIVSATFLPVKSEVLLHALEERGVYVSSGSACSSNKPGLSGTLQSIGLSAKEADCTLRFSFCKDNTAGEVVYVLEQLKELLPLLSRFVSR
ncbi:MAG: cysteine desulfurase [Lachnospiraceae bacterium]|nr:cysteine desulfurase [Lachnospiraceae bacterium]